VIDPVFTGWYLRVADQLLGPGPFLVPLVLTLNSGYGGPVWPAGPLTAVAVVGRIAPATGPRTSPCGPVALPPGANPHHPSYCARGQRFPPCSTVLISARGAARVWCVPIGCQVAIRATRGRHTVRYRTIVTGEATLTLPKRLRARLGSGRARIQVNVDGRRQASRAVRL
jgi:hypothetical protein